MTHNKHRKAGEAAGPQAVVTMRPDRARVVTTFVLGADETHPRSASLHLDIPVGTLDQYANEADLAGQRTLAGPENEDNFKEIPPYLLKRFELFGYTLGARDLVFLILLVPLGFATYYAVSAARQRFAPQFHLIHTSQSAPLQNNDSGVAPNDVPVTFISLDR